MKLIVELEVTRVDGPPSDIVDIGKAITGSLPLTLNTKRGTYKIEKAKIRKDN